MASNGERASSKYAEIYFNDSVSEISQPKTISKERRQVVKSEDNEWVSPSDTLIGIIKLQPPFTSKITRGKTHEGILGIGENIWVEEQKQFVNYLNELIDDNNAAWELILKYELIRIEDKVKDEYEKILNKKNKIMLKEMNIFFEKSLQEVEDNLRSELKHVLISAHANMMTDVKIQIKNKLKKQKDILEKSLRTKTNAEIKKIEEYYDLLLKNEINNNNKLINSHIRSRNDALRAFYRQIESEATTTSMYVMCTERRRCKIKKILLESVHTAEMQEKLKQLQEKQEYLKIMTDKEETLSEINQQWEEKINKILQLFLKFISFSLKLLPEQITFLLNFQKMVILQLNEMKKVPEKTSSILVDVNDNIFLSSDAADAEEICEPFIIEGDTSEIPPKVYGSRETIPLDEELPYFRLQRQYIYAKCKKFEDVKKYLYSKTCHCYEPPKTDESNSEPTNTSKIQKQSEQEQPPATVVEEPSLESITIDEFARSSNCPSNNCRDWLKAKPFPDLSKYVDYSEENYKRVKLGIDVTSQLPIENVINAADVTHVRMPFEETTEKYHDASTQYSPPEPIIVLDECPCIKNIDTQRAGSFKSDHSDVFLKRQRSVQRILQSHPNLLKLFTVESFEFSM